MVFALFSWLVHELYLKSFPTAWRLGAMLLVVLPLSAWLAVVLCGTFLGYLYPWGQSYESQWASLLSLRAYFSTTRQCVQIVQEAFFHATTIAGLFSAVTVVAFVAFARGRMSGSHLVGSSLSLALQDSCYMSRLSDCLHLYSFEAQTGLPHNLSLQSLSEVLSHSR